MTLAQFSKIWCKIQWSPYNANLLALGSSQHFGLKGGGKQEVLKVTDQGIKEIASFYTKDVIYDCAWCEEDEVYLISSCGDGSIVLWDIKQPQQPVRTWQEHKEEVESVDWNVNVCI